MEASTVLAFTARSILPGTIDGTLFASGGRVAYAHIVVGWDPFAPPLAHFEYYAVALHHAATGVA